MILVLLNCIARWEDVLDTERGVEDDQTPVWTDVDCRVLTQECHHGPPGSAEDSPAIVLLLGRCGAGAHEPVRREWVQRIRDVDRYGLAQRVRTTQRVLDVEGRSVGPDIEASEYITLGSDEVSNRLNEGHPCSKLFVYGCPPCRCVVDDAHDEAQEEGSALLISEIITGTDGDLGHVGVYYPMTVELPCVDGPLVKGNGAYVVVAVLTTRSEAVHGSCEFLGCRCRCRPHVKVVEQHTVHL